MHSKLIKIGPKLIKNRSFFWKPGWPIWIGLQLASNPNWIGLAIGWPEVQIFMAANWQIGRQLAKCCPIGQIGKLDANWPPTSNPANRAFFDD